MPGGLFISRLGIAFLAVLTAAAVPAGRGGEAGSQEKGGETKGKAPAKVQLKGMVVDRDGKPVANATVVFQGAKPGETRTNGGGAYSYSAEPGRYTVTATARSGAKSKPTQVEAGNSGIELPALIVE